MGQRRKPPVDGVTSMRGRHLQVVEDELPGHGRITPPGGSREATANTMLVLARR